MKKGKLFVVVVLISLLSITLACSITDGGSNKLDITGTWQTDIEGITIFYEFTSDGRVIVGNGEMSEEVAEYKIDGTTLTLIEPNGTESTTEIILEGDTLTFKDSDGFEFSLTRVK